MLGNELAAAPKDEAKCLALLVGALLKLRQNFRANKQWAEADEIRDSLYRVNITVEDIEGGSRWQLASNCKKGAPQKNKES